MNDRTDRTQAGLNSRRGESKSFASQLAGVAAYIASVPRGERAKLRRIRPDRTGIPPEVFWRIVSRYEIQPSSEDFWLGVTPLMVTHPHRPNMRPGRVLAASGVKPSRFERWLRLDQESAIRESGRLFSRVKEGLDWVSLGHLLRTWNQKNQRQIARDFFLSIEQSEEA